MDTWRTRLRRRFEELKARDGLTQEGLAERVGVTQGTVGHWLSGRRTPDTLATFEALANALSVHPAWLIYGIDVDDSATEAARKLNSLPQARRDAIITLILDR
jgi:transcriptional regulator with XRE-family HTH domain